MRSLIILEVEHGEDTDLVQNMAEAIQNFWPTEVKDYTVKVDLPACFVLD